MEPDPEAFVRESRELVFTIRGENSCSHVRDLGKQRRVLVYGLSGCKITGRRYELRIRCPFPAIGIGAFDGCAAGQDIRVLGNRFGVFWRHRRWRQRKEIEGLWIVVCGYRISNLKGQIPSRN